MPIAASRCEVLADFLACARYGEFEDLRNFQEAQMLAESQDSSTGNTALMFASANGHLEIVTWLLEISRSAINAQNSAGNTALHWASLNGQTPVVAALLHAGASADLRNASGERPFDEAVKRNAFPEICELLARATSFDEDAEAARMADEAGVKLIVSDDSDVDP